MGVVTQDEVEDNPQYRNVSPKADDPVARLNSNMKDKKPLIEPKAEVEEKTEEVEEDIKHDEDGVIQEEDISQDADDLDQSLREVDEAIKDVEDAEILDDGKGEPDLTPSDKITLPRDPSHMSGDEWKAVTDQIISQYQESDLGNDAFERKYGYQIDALANYSEANYSRLVDVMQVDE